jgi:hypothetical protein
VVVNPLWGEANMSYKHHVFLSHNGKDKPAVEAIALKLKKNYELKCWLDKWNLIPGEPWQEALEHALNQCETVAVFVGPNTISPWENEEMRAALQTRVHNKTRRVIPVLLPGAPDSRSLNLPQFLERLTWVDFRAGLNDKNALYRLYCGVRGIEPGVRPTRNKSTSVAISTTKSADVQLFVKGHIEEFNEARKKDITIILSGLLHVPESDIIIWEVREGSVILNIEMPEHAAELLNELVMANNLELIKLGVQSIQINNAVPISIPVTARLPIGSYLPFTRNPYFTGRANYLQSLADQLLKDKNDSSMIPQAIIGTSGIGKTQLAMEFAYRYGYRFRGVHWMDARDFFELNRSIAACGHAMGLEQADEATLVAATLFSWVADGPRLLILENLNEGIQVPSMLSRFQHPSLRLLITSRQKDFSKFKRLHVQELSPFSEAESLEFLNKKINLMESSPAALSLAEMLEYLPLALELAAKYINTHGIRIENYLEILTDFLADRAIPVEWPKEAQEHFVELDAALL